MDLDRLVAQHYESYWGKPEAAYETVWGQGPTEEGRFHIVEFGPRPDHDVWTYASVGMSKREMPGQFPAEAGAPSRRRVELMLYCQPRCTEVVEFLGHLVVFPFANECAIWSGHTIPGQDSVVPGSPLTAVCFAFPHSEPEGFQPICLDREHIYVLWAVPIYEVERQYKVANGSAALWRLFGEKGVKVWDLRRGPAVQ